MAKKNDTKSKNTSTTSRNQSASETQTTIVEPVAPPPATSQPKPASKVGEIWRGETKYIDPEPKKQRNYVVVIDDGKRQTVSKIKSLKIFDENGKNADKALVEINSTRYGLTARSGVDFETFDTNRMSGKPLKVSDKDAFPEDKPRAKLGSRDTSRVLRHTGRLPKQKKKR